MGSIYRIVCGEKCYVGQTRRPVHVRWGEHRRHALAGAEGPLYDALRMAGGTLDVLEECEKSMLNTRERAWIRSLDTLFPNGYNVTPGGASSKRQNRKWGARVRDWKYT